MSTRRFAIIAAALAALALVPAAGAAPGARTDVVRGVVLSVDPGSGRVTLRLPAGELRVADVRSSVGRLHAGQSLAVRASATRPAPRLEVEGVVTGLAPLTVSPAPGLAVSCAVPDGLRLMLGRGARIHVTCVRGTDGLVLSKLRIAPEPAGPIAAGA